jgi:hypothetical protein
VVVLKELYGRSMDKSFGNSGFSQLLGRKAKKIFLF